MCAEYKLNEYRHRRSPYGQLVLGEDNVELNTFRLQSHAAALLEAAAAALLEAAAAALLEAAAALGAAGRSAQRTRNAQAHAPRQRRCVSLHALISRVPTARRRLRGSRPRCSTRVSF
jgi:hypothetical protein